jgi:hypothetical protein
MDDGTGWIDWNGGKRPVEKHVRVQVRHADGWVDNPNGRFAALWTWNPKELKPTNITAYRVVPA